MSIIIHNQIEWDDFPSNYSYYTEVDASIYFVFL